MDNASRLLSKVECKYSQVEKEALAVVWACEKLHMYLDSDNKGFKIILDNRAVDLIYRNPKSKPPIRIQRWALRLSPFNYSIEHKSGKLNCADYLSRKPVNSAEKGLAEEAEIHINAVIDLLVPRTVTRAELVEHTNKDTELQLVIKELSTNGQFDIKELNKFSHKQSWFTVSEDGLVLCQDKIVIPSSLQARVIELAHESHQGQTKTLSLLKSHVWFPGMNKKVVNACNKCEICNIVQEKYQKHPVLLKEMPEQAWDQQAADFYGPMVEDGKFIMVITDLYSRFPEAIQIQSVAGKHVIPELDKICKRFGYPKVIQSDNGAPFNGQEWKDFAGEHNILTICAHQSTMNQMV